MKLWQEGLCQPLKPSLNTLKEGGWEENIANIHLFTADKMGLFWFLSTLYVGIWGYQHCGVKVNRYSIYHVLFQQQRHLFYGANSSIHTCWLVFALTVIWRGNGREWRLADFTQGAVAPGYITAQHTSASEHNCLTQAPFSQPEHKMQPTTNAICLGFLN